MDPNVTYKLNRQETFNRVARHLLTQKERAVTLTEDLGEVCRYRGDNGRTCAVGCLIPNSVYVPKMEGRSADGLFWDYPQFNALFDVDVSGGYLNELQHIHDAFQPEEWATTLFRFAKVNGLNTDVLNEFSVAQP